MAPRGSSGSSISSASFAPDRHTQSAEVETPPPPVHVLLATVRARTPPLWEADPSGKGEEEAREGMGSEHEGRRGRQRPRRRTTRPALVVGVEADDEASTGEEAACHGCQGARGCRHGKKLPRCGGGGRIGWREGGGGPRRAWKRSARGECGRWLG